MLMQSLVITLATLAFIVNAHARDLPVPHGPEVGVMASACAVGDKRGPLGQTSKAGEYNSYCDSLTDAEVCLATIKDSINTNGALKLTSVSNKEKVEHCLESFRNDLIGIQ